MIANPGHHERRHRNSYVVYYTGVPTVRSPNPPSHERPRLTRSAIAHYSHLASHDYLRMVPEKKKCHSDARVGIYRVRFCWVLTVLLNAYL